MFLKEVLRLGYTNLQKLRCIQKNVEGRKPTSLEWPVTSDCQLVWFGQEINGIYIFFAFNKKDNTVLRRIVIKAK